jgi:hypothetical protein
MSRNGGIDSGLRPSALRECAAASHSYTSVANFVDAGGFVRISGGHFVRTISVEREKQSAAKLSRSFVQKFFRKNFYRIVVVIDPVAFFETDSLS